MKINSAQQARQDAAQAIDGANAALHTLNDSLLKIMRDHPLATRAPAYQALRPIEKAAATVLNAAVAEMDRVTGGDWAVDLSEGSEAFEQNEREAQARKDVQRAEDDRYERAAQSAAVASIICDSNDDEGGRR